MAKICNMDCLNCKFDDCINDSLGRKREPSEKVLSMDPKNIKRRQTYAKNRERYLAQKRKYYAEHREEICARIRKAPEDRIKREYKCLCAHCSHFVRRSEGKKGGLWGMCEMSVKDNYNFEQFGFLRPVGPRFRCKRFEMEEKND